MKSLAYRRRSRKSHERIATSGSPRFRRILVPIDFSRPSLKAIPYALAISRQFGADVYLLHIVDETPYPPPPLLTLPPVSRAERSERLMKRLQAVALKYRTSGDVYVLTPREGTAYEEICTVAEQSKTDLIVIGTHGYTGYKHIFLGSTAERVVQHSLCPVLVVRRHPHHWNGLNGPQTRTGFKLDRILVPTDFSDCATVAFDYGAQLACDFNAELRLVHVISPHAYPFGGRHAALDAGRLMRQASDAAQNQMRETARETKVRYSLKVEHGSPATEICEAANQDADLIVISTHGRTGLRHALIGSTAEHVVRFAHCPVLVVPAGNKSSKQKEPQEHSLSERSNRNYEKAIS